MNKQLSNAISAALGFNIAANNLTISIPNQARAALNDAIVRVYGDNPLPCLETPHTSLAAANRGLDKLHVKPVPSSSYRPRIAVRKSHGELSQSP